MELTKEQHATNIKIMMLNHVDAVYDTIKRGAKVEDDKRCELWLEKVQAYCNKHNIN